MPTSTDVEFNKIACLATDTVMLYCVSHRIRHFQIHVLTTSCFRVPLPNLS